MSALPEGSKAPDFSLPTLDGATFSLSEALTRGPVVLAFFKVSCPVCQYAFPFFERIHQAHPGLTIVGVSQHPQKETLAFNKEYGISFPTLLDDTKTYSVSNAYGLTNVPSIFWIDPSGRIEVSSVGWVKKEVEDVHRRANTLAHSAAKPLFDAKEQVADFRAG